MNAEVLQKKGLQQKWGMDMLQFKNVIGHEQVIAHLQNAIRMDKVSHAYLISGEEGSGKKMLADIFAATLLCEEHGVEPCGSCKSCMQAQSDNQPDVIYVKHEKLTIGVDDIRTQVNQDIGIKPYQGKYKIYIIEDADKMTEAAQNALLKTIEEPPAYAVVILLASKTETLLKTILSRCVLLTLRPVDQGKIKNLLMEQYAVPDYMAELAAAFSGGVTGRAIRFAASEDFTAHKDEVLHLVKYIEEMSVSEIMEAVKGLATKKDLAEEYLDLVLLWYRDVLLFKATKDPNSMIYKDEISWIKRQADTRTFENLAEIIEAIEIFKQRIRANVNFDMALELLLLTIKENGNQ